MFLKQNDSGLGVVPHSSLWLAHYLKPFDATMYLQLYREYMICVFAFKVMLNYVKVLLVILLHMLHRNINWM